MVLLGGLVLQVLAFDAHAAAAAEAAVELVVVELAVRSVVDDIEGGGREWLRARRADEACLVVSAGKSPVGARYGLARDRQPAGLAVAPGRLWCGPLCCCRGSPTALDRRVVSARVAPSRR